MKDLFLATNCFPILLVILTGISYNDFMRGNVIRITIQTKYERGCIGSVDTKIPGMGSGMDPAGGPFFWGGGELHKEGKNVPHMRASATHCGS